MNMQGLQKNAYQFYLLVLVNAFVGAMIGLERSVLSGLGEQVFDVSAYTVILSFILAFGFTKALANLAVAILSSKFTRKKILILGWIAALPVPFLLMYARSWEWIIVANVLLGINQGLAWSSTVIMKIDLVGSKNRGLAMGINEFAGYLSVGLAALLAGNIAARWGYQYYPFLPGVFFVMAGLLISIFLVKDTSHLVAHETAQSDMEIYPKLWQQISWRHHNMGSVSINGLINNMNDAMVWGLLPLLLIQRDFTTVQIAWVAGIYPAVWGLSQLFTGTMGDRFCKKQIISAGMFLQGAAILLFVFFSSFPLTVIASVLLGIGTALVYPNFLTVIAENLHPTQRAKGLSIFRFWRDSGYVLGALLAGVLADIFGLSITLMIVAGITVLGGVLAEIRMCCTLRQFWKSNLCSEAAVY
jgi:MFS family permease